MADEVTATTFNDVVYAAIITAEILKELRPKNVMRGFLRQGTAGPSKVYQFPILDKPAALPATLAEGADIGVFGSGNEPMTTSNAQVTAAQLAQKATATKFLQKVSIIDAYGTVSDLLTRGMYEKFETDATALLDGFSNVTTAASTLSVASFLAALGALEQRDVDGMLVSVLHPKQTGELRNDIVSSGAVYFTGGANSGGIANEPQQNGYVGELFGVPVHQCTLVVSSGGDRHGAIFTSREALGLYEIWGPTVETFYEVSALSTEFVISQCYGVGEISDTRGQELASDA